MSSTIELFITISCISTHSIISWWCISSIKHNRKHKLWYMNNPYLCVQLFFNIFHLFYVVLSSKRSAPTGRGASSPTDRRLLSDQSQWLWGGEWVSSIVYVFSWFFGRCLFFSESSGCVLDLRALWGGWPTAFFPYIPQKGDENPGIGIALNHQMNSSEHVNIQSFDLGHLHESVLLRLRLDHKMAFPWRICTWHSRPNKTSKKKWRNCETIVGFESFSRPKIQVSFIPRNDYGYIKKKTYQYIIPSP